MFTHTAHWRCYLVVYGDYEKPIHQYLSSHCLQTQTTPVTKNTFDNLIETPNQKVIHV